MKELVEFTVRRISDCKQFLMKVMNEYKLHVIKSKMFALTPVLLSREMLSYEPKVLLNSWKFEARINIKRLSVI